MSERLSILFHYLRARRNFTRWRTRGELEAWQHRQVVAHLTSVVVKSPYYKQLIAGRKLSSWREFPISNKAAVMKGFDRWNTVGISIDEAWQAAEQAERTRDFAPRIRGITVGLSSGTSGSRGIFLVADSERTRWAGTMLARILQGTLRHRHRAAMLFRANSNLYQSVGSRRFSFDFFDLLEPLAGHGAALAKLGPTILAAPPSALVQLAAVPEVASSLAAPRLVLSMADVLEDGEKQSIEAGFGVACGQIYQATEGFLAATCPHGNLHWNEDTVVVQKHWLDEAKTRYLPVLTDFQRTTQPVIRYLLDDVIVEPERADCPCGSVFGRLGKIEGRKDDILRLRADDDAGWVDVFPDFVRRSIVLAVPDGVEYSVVQPAPELLQVALSDPNWATAVTAEINELCMRLRARMPKIEFTLWTPPPLHQKRRRIRRAFSIELPK